MTDTPRSRHGSKRRSRIYWRGGAERRADGSTAQRFSRAYADFRDFADVGGGREPLIPPGATRATDDAVVAEELVTQRLGELKRLRRDRALIGESRAGATLGEVARQHLILKAEAGKQSRRWLVCAELHLKRACEFFGSGRRLSTIAVEDLHRWLIHLETIDSGRGGKLAAGTRRHHLNSLSSVFRRAQSLGLVPVGMNPVAAIMPGERPIGRRSEAAWLEVHEAAHLLEVARRFPRPVNTFPHMYELVATMLLTGMRKSEALGLAVEDVSFERKTVTLRPHPWRRLKNEKSARVIPLWPQLAAILGPFLVPMDRSPRTGLLFSAIGRSGTLGMVTDFDKALDRIAIRAGWRAGEIRSRIFRNTYAAAALQRLDRGQPVSPYTVARELGHSNLEMLQAIYGHASTTDRHRSEVVEFRAELHADRIRQRFGDVVTNSLTPQPESAGRETV